MRICFLIGSMATSGGIERVTANLANMWCDMGYEVDIVVLSEDTSSFFHLSDKVRVISIRVEQYLPGSKISMLLWLIKIVKRFYNHVKANRPDIVLGIWTSMACCAILAGLLNRIPVVACEHIEYYGVKYPLQLLRRLVYPFATAVVTLTQRDQILYQAYCDKVVTIPNAVSFETDLIPNYNSKKVLAVGRLVKQKGFDLLIKAWREVVSKHSDWKLNIVGRKGNEHDDESEYLLELVRDFNLQDSVSILPPTKNIISHYMDASIFVMSSRYEGLPMVLIEAMCMGLPVISFNCPTGPAEIINHMTDGILVDNSSIVKLADSICTLIEDETLRISLGANAKIVKQRYSRQTIKFLWNSLFTQIMSERVAKL